MNEENTTLTIARQKVLTDFFDHFVTVNKSLGKKDLTKAEIEKAID